MACVFLAGCTVGSLPAITENSDGRTETRTEVRALHHGRVSIPSPLACASSALRIARATDLLQSGNDIAMYESPLGSTGSRKPVETGCRPRVSLRATSRKTTGPNNTKPRETRLSRGSGASGVWQASMMSAPLRGRGMQGSECRKSGRWGWSPNAARPRRAPTSERSPMRTRCVSCGK